ncbi:MAG: glycerophosphodiester phosphodiesterase [Planctomycetota bacterium]
MTSPRKNSNSSTPKRITRALASAVVTAFLLATGSASASDTLPLIVAHRGASHDAPENTLAAFRLAWEHKADVVECDVWLTANQQIVCLHDKTVGRTTGQAKGTGPSVTASTLEDLQALDVGAWKHERFRGETIPRLADALAIVPKHGRVFIEIKDSARIIPHLARVIADAKLRPEQITVLSFDVRVIAASKITMPDIAAHWLTGFKIDKQTNTPTLSLDAVLATLALTGADGLGARALPDHLNADFVTALKASGYAVGVWTINDPNTARFYARLGVDAITTDRPAWLRLQLNAIANASQP